MKLVKTMEKKNLAKNIVLHKQGPHDRICEFKKSDKTFEVLIPVFHYKKLWNLFFCAESTYSFIRDYVK
jgi:hypothetical protein